MNDLLRKSALPAILLASTVLFAGCASQGKPPPAISLDEPVQAQPLPEPPKPVEVVTVPQPLALPSQLKPLPEGEEPPSMRSRCGPSPMARCTRSMQPWAA